MIEFLMLLSLSPLSGQQALMADKPFQPCVWPNTCKTEQVLLADYEICVWPRTCGAKTQPEVVNFEPCVWPNTCKQEEPKQVAQFEPCVWPNCSGNGRQEILQLAGGYEICLWPNTCGAKQV